MVLGIRDCFFELGEPMGYRAEFDRLVAEGKLTQHAHHHFVRGNPPGSELATNPLFAEMQANLYVFKKMA